MKREQKLRRPRRPGELLAAEVFEADEVDAESVASMHPELPRAVGGTAGCLAAFKL